MRLILRLRKKGSERFAEYPIDEDDYSLNELQGTVNYGLEHQSAVTIAVDMPRKKFVKFLPKDMSSIAFLYEHDA